MKSEDKMQRRQRPANGPRRDMEMFRIQNNKDQSVVRENKVNENAMKIDGTLVILVAASESGDIREVHLGDSIEDNEYVQAVVLYGSDKIVFTKWKKEDDWVQAKRICLGMRLGACASRFFLFKFQEGGCVLHVWVAPEPDKAVKAKLYQLSKEDVENCLNGDNSSWMGKSPTQPNSAQNGHLQETKDSANLLAFYSGELSGDSAWVEKTLRLVNSSSLRAVLFTKRDLAAIFGRERITARLWEQIGKGLCQVGLVMWPLIGWQECSHILVLPLDELNGRYKDVVKIENPVDAYNWIVRSFEKRSA